MHRTLSSRLAPLPPPPQNLRQEESSLDAQRDSLSKAKLKQVRNQIRSLEYQLGLDAPAASPRPSVGAHPVARAASRVIFDSMDSDGDRKLTREEFRAGVTSSRPPKAAPQGDGPSPRRRPKINFDDLLAGAEKEARQDRQTNKAFDALDADGDGFVSATELQDGLTGRADIAAEDPRAQALREAEEQSRERAAQEKEEIKRRERAARQQKAAEREEREHALRMERKRERVREQQARPALLLGSWDTFQGPSHETFCVLNHQRRLTLPRPTAALTATQLRVCLTRRCLWAAGVQRNVTLYNELFNKTGRAIITENCHQARRLRHCKGVAPPIPSLFVLFS